MLIRVLSKYVRGRNLSHVVFRSGSQSTFRKLFQHSRNFSSSSDIDDVQEDSIADLESVPLNKVKNRMRNCANDAIMQDFKKFTSEEIKAFITKANQLDKLQLCQLSFVLWENMKTLSTAPDYDLEALMTRTNELLDEMLIDEVSFCQLYLNKLGFSMKHLTMERMTNRILEEMQREDFPLLSLSQFTVCLNTEKGLGLYSHILAATILPEVFRRLESCSDVEDLYLIVICLNNISQVISLRLLEIFKKKIQEFIDTEKLNETSSKCILKIINLLNYPHWSSRNCDIIRQLMLQLEDNIQLFDIQSLMTISRAFQSQMEPSRLVPLIVKRAQQLTEKTPGVELLSLAVLDARPEQRTRIAEKLREFLSTYQISSKQSGETLQHTFKILRLLKISDISLCDSYWIKVLNETYATKSPSVNFRLSKNVHKYMYFNNNLGGTYRHREFEHAMVQMLKAELKKTLSPKDFARYASFIIAYSDSSVRFPKFVVNKIEELHKQFSIQDCVLLSRGLQIFHEMRPKTPLKAEQENQIELINYSLGKCTERHLKTEDLHLSELTGILRAYNSRRGSRDTYLFHQMINRYNTHEKLPLNSRNIRDICFNLTYCNFRVDLICDQFIDYILANWDIITGDTVEKILTCCYTFSYFPEKIDVLDRSSEIIIRDFNYMSGLSIVQALLALIFYKSCPQQLISKVFSSDFIKRLEMEIQMCYSKNTYPMRVMNQVMQLNRAVCLDCPELNVNWFEQSYIEAQATKAAVIKSRVYMEVKDLLTRIVKSSELLYINRVTPYGYRIDFELYIDQYNRFVKPLPEDYQHKNYLPQVNKIAVLLLSNKVFCDNDISRLKGPELLRMRHLEMLGYRVVHVKIADFCFAYRNVATRLNYLKTLLHLTA